MAVDGLPARKAALSLLSGVLTRRKPLDADLPQLKALPPRDAAFARALASQTLRHLGALEHALRGFLSKPLSQHKSGAAMEILLLGACELLVLKTPAHAAVDAANRLAASDSKAVHFKPLINAVLRKVANVALPEDAARLSTPDWLWQRWTAQYGDETAQRIAQAHLRSVRASESDQNRGAPLDITLRADGVAHPQSAPLFGLSRRVIQDGRVEDLPGFSDGQWWVQDVAAALPALLLGDVRGKEVIDLCAAPGGKTLQLASAGAHVTAVEKHAARMQRVRENLARTGLTATLAESDARDFEGRAALVLIDAPCTATGTIRRHPELPWIKGAADVTVMAALAYEILEAGARMVMPCGRLVFAVCSLEREEGEEQIAAFLSSHPEFARDPIQAQEVFGHADWLTPEGDLRTLPFMLEGGMDGFFAARLKKL
ncbi:MAG: RsmB/NOP family class I SAM-dependent RNA methyltransferase [Alphaproteobacteria bacterium]|nr:RsmB/NOP family class I SAM-dependent RNA methyltransferase [Alphaproteobacteria bacterium]